MSFHGGDFALASNLFLLLSVFWLVYARLDAQYCLQVTALLTAMLASFSYHACWTSDFHWCAGGGSEDPRAVAMARDILAAYQSMSVVGILVDQWWLGRRGSGHSPRLFAWFCVLSMLFTFVMVVLFGTGDETIVTTSVGWGLVFAYALLHDRRAHDSAPWAWWAWARLVFAVACLATAAGVRSAALQDYDQSAGASQSDAYDGLHGATHILFGMASLALVTLVDGRSEYAPVATTSTKLSSTAAKAKSKTDKSGGGWLSRLF